MWQSLRAQAALGDFVWVETQEAAAAGSAAANWPQRQWWHTFCELFGADGAAADADDMLFCVLRAPPPGAPPFVALRRPTSGLPESLAYGGRMYHAADWQDTVQLNAVMHASFRLTLSVRRCGPYLLLSLTSLPSHRAVSTRVSPRLQGRAGPTYRGRGRGGAGLCGEAPRVAAPEPRRAALGLQHAPRRRAGGHVARGVLCAGRL